METEVVKISKIKKNPNNPRLVKDDKFKKLVQSIKDFPEMLKIRPIVVNEDMVVLGGNMRLRACKDAGLKDVPIIQASELTEKQQREFIIKDNVGFGEWDWDLIANEWDLNELDDWGFKLPNFGNTDMVNTVNSGDEYDEWVGMPEFNPKENTLKIVVSFENEADREEFGNLHNLQFIKKQQNAWMTRYPWVDREDLISLKYE